MNAQVEGPPCLVPTLLHTGILRHFCHDPVREGSWTPLAAEASGAGVRSRSVQAARQNRHRGSGCPPSPCRTPSRPCPRCCGPRPHNCAGSAAGGQPGSSLPTSRTSPREKQPCSARGLALQQQEGRSGHALLGPSAPRGAKPRLLSLWKHVTAECTSDSECDLVRRQGLCG